MGKVVSSATMSLDGFIAYPDHTVGALFDWFDAGEIAIPSAHPDVSFHLTQPSAEYWTRWTESLGALVVGRTLFDITDGWQGIHPLGVPVVVLTHDRPEDWAFAGSSNFHFVSEGVTVAVETAQALAGDRVVAVAAGTIASQCLAAGLLDEVAIDLVPLIIGEGRPYFAATGTWALGEPTTVVLAPGVTHLVLPVSR